MRPASFIAAVSMLAASTGSAAQLHGSSQTSPIIPDGLESPLATWITPQSTGVNPIRPSKRLATAAAEKPVMEASLMGLIVFSAAGLFLL